MPQVVTPRERGRPRVQTLNEEPSLTVQSDRVRSEIKHIMRTYDKTGVLLPLQQVDLAFHDVTNFTDYVDVMRHAKTAEAEFLKLPSKVREVFNHDVMRWLDVAHDPEKLDPLRPQLEKLGVPKAVEAVQAVPTDPPVETSTE